jgi:hypothetical protein
LKTEEIPADERPDRKPSSSAPTPVLPSRHAEIEQAPASEGSSWVAGRSPAAASSFGQRSTVRLPTADTEPSAVMAPATEAHELAPAKQIVKIVPAAASPIQDPLERWLEPAAAALPAELERRPLTSEGCLVCGAVRFASLSPQPTPFERALRAFCATELDDPARMGRLHFILMAVTAATARGRAFVRGALARVAGATADEYAEIDLLLRKFSVSHSEPAERATTAHDKLCLIALGAAELVEPEHEHARAREALAALSSQTNKDERQVMFVVSVLTSFARTPPELQAGARGALLAMLSGSDEDAKLAHHELAEFVRTAKRMSRVAESPANPGRTRVSARELARVPMPWLDPGEAQPPPPVREATHATPGGMTTPAEPVRDVAPNRAPTPRRRAFDPRIAVGVALISTLLVIGIAVLIRPLIRPGPHAAGSAASSEAASSEAASTTSSVPVGVNGPAKTAPASERSAVSEPAAASAQPSSSSSSAAPEPAAPAATAHAPVTAAPRETLPPTPPRGPTAPKPAPATTTMPGSGL